MDGLQAAAKIRTLTLNTPLIAITSDDELKDTLLKAGFNEIIIKPFHGKELIKIIKSYLYPAGRIPNFDKPKFFQRLDQFSLGEGLNNISFTPLPE